MSNRPVAILGVAAAAGAGYYLYQAGGSPKVAEKKLEHDAARLSSSVRGEIPGKEKEIKTQAKVLGEEAGQKIDSAIGSIKSQTNQADAKLEAYRKDAEKNIDQYKNKAANEAHNAIDKFDKSVEQGAAKLQQSAQQAKGGLSSWFGGK